ncbi:MAG: hypothetical protein AAB420_02785 [Patescibacteria group bacterium]
MDKETKNYLDKKFDAVDKKFDAIDNRFDQQSKEIKAVEQRLSAKIDDLNDRTARGFRDLEGRLDVKARVEKLERNYEKIKEALHLAA